ncbi:hypothetical protein BT69DRAFT_1350344 [Atractiella rhizophila]|nr:hypothetical protein BT69DRAFT_1350344 [Atractiella rhizophila]
MANANAQVVELVNENGGVEELENQGKESLLAQETFDLTLLLPAPSYIPPSLLHPTTFSTFLPSPTEPQERVTIVELDGKSYMSLHLAISPLETVRELRQSLLESDEGRWLPASCGLAKVGSEKEEYVGEWSEIGKVWEDAMPAEGEKRILKVVDRPLTEPTSRVHIQKFRDFITSTPSNPGATASGTDYGFVYDPNAMAIGEGISVFPGVRAQALPRPAPSEVEEKPETNASGKKNNKGKSKSKPTESGGEDTSAADALTQTMERVKSFCSSASNIAQSPFEVYTSTFPSPPQVSSLPPYLRSFSLSQWNPPPHPLRLRKGHHFYLHAQIVEGDNLHITSHAGGYTINRSDNHHFDPSPRAGQRSYPTLWELFCSISPAFKSRLNKTLQILSDENIWLLTGGGGVIPDDPPLSFFSKVQIPTYPPAHPFLVPQPSNVQPDGTRMQLPFLQGFKDPAVRDWNEELVSCREMPRAKPAERLLRERMKARVMWELREEIVRGVERIGRGEMESLVPFSDLDSGEKENSTEESKETQKPDEHTYVWNGVLYVKAGGDGAQFKGFLGGDDAARVAAGKDVRGAETCEELDIGAVGVGEGGETGLGLQTLGTAVVDFMGERWVGQSLLPGILWRAKEDEEKAKDPERGFLSDADVLEGNKEPPQTNFRIVYGLADPDDVDSTKVNAAPWFEEKARKVGDLFRVDRHNVEQPDGTSKELALSREVHGLLGTDGRAYLIDLYRLYPMDLEFLENDLESAPFSEVSAESTAGPYPHRLTLLRPELLDRYVLRQISKHRIAEASSKLKEGKATEEKTEEKEIDLENSISEAMDAPISPSASEKEKKLEPTEQKEPAEEQELLPRFNTDAYLDRISKEEHLKPLTEDELSKEPKGVKNVREAAKFLRNELLREFVLETGLAQGHAVHIDYDGLGLTQRLHAKGINMRYLGKLVAVVEDVKKGNEYEQAKYEMDFTLRLLKAQMVFRACKHLLRRWFRTTNRYEISNMLSHFFNCLLTPSSTAATITPDLSDLIDIQPSEPVSEWLSATRESVRADLIHIIATRFRYCLASDYFENDLPRAPLLREICKRMNIQLALKEYKFEWESEETESEEHHSPELGKVHLNGNAHDNGPVNGPVNGQVNGSSKKKKSKKGKAEVEKQRKTLSVVAPEDVINIAPVVKSVLHKSRYADLMFDQGRIAFLRGHLEGGQELLQDALTYHEQIFGPIHPTMAAFYGALAMLYHQQGREHFQRLTLFESAQAELQAANDDEKEAAARRLEERSIENPDILRMEAENYIHTSIKMMRQAAVISERATGIDSLETIQIYQELAAIELSIGNIEIGIHLIAHTLKLINAVYGLGHPDQVKVINTASIIVQQLFGNVAALPIVELQTKISTDIYQHPSAVPTSEHSSLLPHPTHGSNLYSLGQLHTINGDLSACVKFCNQALKIFEATLGPSSPQSLECRNVLEIAMKTEVGRKKSERERLVKRLGINGERIDAIRAARMEKENKEEEQVIRPFSTAVGDISVEALASWVNGGSLPTASTSAKTIKSVPSTRARTSSISTPPTPKRGRRRGKK